MANHLLCGMLLLEGERSTRRLGYAPPLMLRANKTRFNTRTTVTISSSPSLFLFLLPLSLPLASLSPLLPSLPPRMSHARQLDEDVNQQRHEEFMAAARYAERRMEKKIRG